MKIKHSTVILLLILLMFLADGANSILVNLGVKFYRVSIFVRLFSELYFLYLLIQKDQGRKVLRVVSIFFILFVISASIGLSSHINYNLFDNFVLVNKMILIFISFAIFKYYFNSIEEQRRLLMVFEALILLQSFSIITAFIFHLDILSAYGNRRFGYQGFIPAQNEISAFFIIAFFYFLWKYVYFKKGFIQLIITLVAGLFTGTKVALLLPAVLLFFAIKYLIYLLLQGRTFRVRAELLILPIMLIITIVVFWEPIFQRINPTIEYYSYWISQPSYSIIDAVMGGRTLKVQDFFAIYVPRFDALNLLFGGHDLTLFATETDFLDVIAITGLIGGLIFYWLYLKTLLFQKNRVHLVHFLFVVTWLGISFTAGHLVFSAINSSYLSILLVAFYANRTNLQIVFSKEKRRSTYEVIQYAS